MTTRPTALLALVGYVAKVAFCSTLRRASSSAITRAQACCDGEQGVIGIIGWRRTEMVVREREMGDVRSLRRDELETLRNTLACILQEENPLPPQEHEAREAELSRRLSSTSSNGSSTSPGQALHSQDISIITRLLNQVHQLIAEEDGREIWVQPEDKRIPDSVDPQVATQKTMVDAVVEIAGAAAEAARAAAASSGKNLEVMETLLSDYENKGRHRLAASEGKNEVARKKKGHDEESSQQAAAVDKDAVKRLERQNRITHWVLGLTIVATAIWRWKMLTMILGVRRTFSNPFQALGDMVSEGFKGGSSSSSKEDAAAGGTKGFNKAKTVLPSILGGEEEITTKTQKTERSITEDFKIGEALTESLGNLFPSDDSEGHESKGRARGRESKGATKEASSK